MLPFVEHFSRYVGSAMLRQRQLGQWIEQFQNHAVNMTEGTICFDNRVTLPIQVIGSVATSAQSWVWAWANDESNFSDAILVESRRVKAYGEAHGISELTNRRFSLTEFNGHVLAMFAAGICGERAYISAPNGGLEVFFFADEAIDFSETTPTQTVISVIPQIVEGFDVDHRVFAEAFLIDQGFEVRADGNNGRANLTCSRDGDEFELIMDDRGRLTNIQGNMRGQA
jgi:hypothetical protein